MFSFHRPKVYRSSTGCCICKAKSSSSRFTDSKKYEEDFLECFKLETPRQGEICNACVLLVKRWKKLPAGSDRNWQHVVDARAGPGMKSFTKFKTKNKKITGDKNEKPIKKKLTVAHFDREYSPGLSDKSEGPEDLDNDMDFLPEDGPSVNSSRNGSTGGSDSEEAIVVPEMKTRNRRRKGISKRLEEIRRPNVSGFIDLDYWTKETICCGAIFRGRNDEILLDYSHFKPCAGRLAMCRTNNKTTKGPETATVPVTTTSPGAVTSTTKGLYTSDSSSDSGYDDCSNQGYVGMSPPRQVPNPSADVTETDLTCHETIFSTAQEEEVAVHSDGDVIMTSETPTICAN